MAGQMQGPLSFEDVAVYLSRAEWDSMAEGQRELYRSVMLDNYNLLTSLGYPGPKPDLLHRLERGEEPWGCTPRSPGGWAAPDGPSTGHNGDGSWLEASGWWPGAAVHHESEDRTQLPHQERSVQWRLRTRRLLNKLKGLRTESQAEETRRAVGTVESRDQALPVLGPGKEGAAEDGQEATANGPQRGGIPRGPALEQAAPAERQHGDRGERLLRTAPESPHALGEVWAFPQAHRDLPSEELAEIVWHDHCYCGTGGTWARTAPSSLREHDYCSQNTRDSALKDHKYCQVQRCCVQCTAHRTPLLHRWAWAAFPRLPRRKSPVGKLIEKAKRLMWHLAPCAHRRVGAPQGKAPPAEGGDEPLERTPGGAALARERVPPPQPASESGSQSGTRRPLGPAAVSCGASAPPPRGAALTVRGDAQPPGALAPRRLHRARLARSPQPTCHAAGPGCGSLHRAYVLVMRTVDHVLDSVCQSFEHGGCRQHEELWPIAIHTDG